MRNLTFLFSIFALSLRKKTLWVRPDSSWLCVFVLKLCVLCAFRSRYFPIGGMQEPGMLVSEDQSLEFLTDLGYAHLISPKISLLSSSFPLAFSNSFALMSLNLSLRCEVWLYAE